MIVNAATWPDGSTSYTWVTWTIAEYNACLASDDQLTWIADNATVGLTTVMATMPALPDT